MSDALEHLSREALIARLKQQEAELCTIRRELQNLCRTAGINQDAVCEEMRRQARQECRIMEADAKRRCEALESATAAHCRAYWDALAQAIASYAPLQLLSQELHSSEDDETFGIDD